MSRSTLSACIVLILLPQLLPADERGWWNYTNGQEVRAICVQDEFVWMGSYGGLIKVDRTTGDRSIYTRANSGLPCNIIHSLACTQTGELWVGTPDGLANYDGQIWNRFTMSNSGLPSNCILSLVFIDSMLWVGTGPYGYDDQGNLFGGGLSSFDGVEWKTYTQENSGLPSNVIKAVGGAGCENLWLSTGAGLVRYTGSAWHLYDTTSGMPTTNVGPLAMENDILWIGTWMAGLVRYDGSSWTNYTTSNSGLPDNTVMAIDIDENGTKWIGSYEGGISSFDNSTWLIYDTFNSALPNDNVYAISMDNRYDLWIGTWDGAIKFDGDSWYPVETSNSPIPDNYVTMLFIDHDNTIWMSSSVGRRGFYGLAAKNDDNWMFYNTTNSNLNSDVVICMIEASFGDYWMSTAAGGITRFDGDNWIVYDPGNSDLPDPNVSSLTVDHDGTIWAGTSGGLVRIAGSVWDIYTTENSPLPDNDIRCLDIDENNGVWIGTRDGLAFYNSTEWDIYSETNSGLPSSIIADIEMGPDGHIWIGSDPYETNGEYFGGGLCEYDHTQWTLHDLPFSSTWINDIACKEDGTVLMSGGDLLEGEGLARLENGEWSLMNSENSHLANNRVRAIAVDTFGNEWIGTVRGGLACYHTMWSAGTEDTMSLPIRPNPKMISLETCYPNPFSHSINLRFHVFERRNVSIKISNSAGRAVKELHLGELDEGMHETIWDGTDRYELRAPSGIYYCRLDGGEYYDVKPVILLR